MAKRSRVKCKGCGWDGAYKRTLKSGHFKGTTTTEGPYNDARANHPDLMKRTRGTPKSWRDGYCALCVWEAAK